MEIPSLQDLGYSLKKPIPVVIEVLGNEFVAEFQEAGIVTSGPSVLDAVRSLKSLVVDLFEAASREKKLGAGPRSQFDALGRHIGEKTKPH